MYCNPLDYSVFLVQPGGECYISALPLAVHPNYSPWPFPPALASSTTTTYTLFRLLPQITMFICMDAILVRGTLEAGAVVAVCADVATDAVVTVLTIGARLTCSSISISNLRAAAFRSTYDGKLALYAIRAVLAVGATHAVDITTFIRHS